MANVMEVVIIGVLRHAPVEVRPRQDILFENVELSEEMILSRKPTMASCLFSIVFTAISARK